MSGTTDLLAQAARVYAPHRLVLGIVVVPALAVMLVFAQWWLFWPLMIWSLVFLVHFLVFKSLSVSSDWITERTARTAEKAYDLAIIEALHERYEPRVSGQETPVEEAKRNGDESGRKREPGSRP